MNPISVLGFERQFVIGNAIDVKSLKTAWGLDDSELSAIFKINRQQVHYMSKKENYRPETYRERIIQRSSELSLIYNLLKSLLKKPKKGSETAKLDDKIEKWLRLPNVAFENKQPIELISTGKGRTIIKALLDEMHGMTA